MMMERDLLTDDGGVGGARGSNLLMHTLTGRLASQEFQLKTQPRASVSARRARRCPPISSPLYLANPCKQTLTQPTRKWVHSFLAFLLPRRGSTGSQE